MMGAGTRSVRHRRWRVLQILGPALAAVVFVAGCGASGPPPPDAGDRGQKPESGAAGKRVTVGGTEAIIWGDGDQGAVLSHGAAYDAASWEPQGQALAENGVVALAVEDTSAQYLRSAID